MNEIELTRKINLDVIRVKATIGYIEKHPFLKAIAQIIHENNGGDFGDISNKVSVELLDDEPKKIVSDNLINRLELLKVIDISRGNWGITISLSKTGENFVNSGELISPKDDVFEFEVILNDNFLEPRIVSSIPIIINWENNTKAKVKELNYDFQKSKDQNSSINYYQSFDQGSKKFDLLPVELKALYNKIYQLLDKSEIHIFSIEDHGKKVNNNKSIEFKINISESHIKQTLTSSRGKIVIEDDDFDDFNVGDHYAIVKQLLEDEGVEFNTDYKSVLIEKSKLEKLEKKALTTASHTVSLNRPKLHYNNFNFGVFANSKISNIPLIAKDMDTASYWAKELIMDKIAKYITRNEFNQIFSEISDLPQFVYSRPKQIDFDEFLDELQFGNQKYWYMQTKLDLNEGVLL